MMWRVAMPAPRPVMVGWRSAKFNFWPRAFFRAALTFSAWRVATPAPIPVIVGWRCTQFFLWTVVVAARAGAGTTSEVVDRSDRATAKAERDRFIGLSFMGSSPLK